MRELAEQLREAVIERIDDEFGLELPQLYIVNISLPAEVEKALDIHGKKDIEDFGIKPFISRCIQSVFRYTEAWEKITDQIGRDSQIALYKASLGM